MQTIKFYTLGCKANQYDTQSIREKFLSSGFQEINNGKKADLYLINTCTVTHRADSDSLNLIRRVKRENPKAKIIVTGCLTELDSDRIKTIEGIDLIVKNSKKEKILNLLRGQSPPPRRRRGKGTVPVKGISSFAGHTRAFLKIQDGCDNFCSYCKVPLVRGRSRNRPKEEILLEAKQLVKNGFKEIVLTGICLGAYRDLVGLIEKLEKIPGLLRIRLSSIEAGDVSDELIEKIAKSDKICRHLHIPLQSGDDGILKRMNRKYSRVGYLKLIRKIKRKIPQIAITTDVLVGFPGESEKNFRNTFDLLKKIMPLKAHIFPYSERNGTAAAGFKEKVKIEVIRERSKRLEKLADFCSLRYRKKFLGKVMPVLIEGRVKNKLDGSTALTINPERSRRIDFWQGYTDNYIKVRLKSRADLKNQLLALKLTGGQDAQNL